MVVSVIEKKLRLSTATTGHGKAARNDRLRVVLSRLRLMKDSNEVYEFLEKEVATTPKYREEEANSLCDKLD